MVKTGFIYCIKSKFNGMVYVGKAKTCHIRWGEHIRMFQKGRHDNHFLRRDVKILGIRNFEFSVLEEVVLDTMDEREKFWINHFAEAGISYNLGSNKHYLTLRKSQIGWLVPVIPGAVLHSPGRGE